MSINKVLITGNLTRDAQLRQTNANSTPVLNFSVAVNDRRKNQQTGEYEDYANYVDCSVFGNRAVALEQFLKKGVKVAVEGKLRWSQWTDKDDPTKKRSTLNVLADNVEFMSSRNHGDSAAPAPAASAPAVPASDYDDDVPF
jgi:single-strand DNA-binding protein